MTRRRRLLERLVVAWCRLSRTHFTEPDATCPLPRHWSCLSCTWCEGCGFCLGRQDTEDPSTHD